LTVIKRQGTDSPIAEVDSGHLVETAGDHSHEEERMHANPVADLSPDRILELGLGFWGSKALLSAVELDLFTTLAAGPLDGETLRKRLGVHERGARDFFDALVALGMLERRDGRYQNTPETDCYLDRNRCSYVGGFLHFADERL
jgi:Dimerisation domain